MKKLFLTLSSALLMTMVVTAAEFYVYPATVKLPVVRVVNNVTETRTLVSADIVNIALGRPLGTKLDRGKYLALTGNDNELAPAGSLVIFDSTMNRIDTVIGNMSAINFLYDDDGRGAKATGVLTGTFAEVGNPAVAKFFATSTLYFAGSSSAGPADPFDFRPSGRGSSTMVNGRIKCIFTPKDGTATAFEGLVVKGTVSAGGKPAVIDVP